MGWWKQLLSGNRKENTEKQSEEDTDGVIHRKLRLEDPKERENYVTACLEQMRIASDATDECNGEYNLVTTYLKDMEEIERLPEDFGAQIRDYATKIRNLEKETVARDKKVCKITEKQFLSMERLEKEMPSGYERMEKAETFQKAVKYDMTRVEAEKQAFFYQENELVTMHANLRGIAIISIMADIVCIFMMLIIFLLLELDVRLGAIITVAAEVITLTVVFVKNQNAMKELARVRRDIAKVIALQNTVKIRYVNNTNLLDYLHMKFDVKQSSQLKDIWEEYLKEKVEREKYAQTRFDLDYYREELLKVLKKLHIAYPQLWLHQTAALIDAKEMVEIRHGLILRRQQLRKQMEDSRKMAEDAQYEIKSIALQYPSDSVKILRILEEYEKSDKK